MKSSLPELAPATLAVRVTPRASANAVTRYADGVLYLRLTAPPVEGAANAACCRVVAKLLRVPASQVSVKSGQKSRDKVLTISGITGKEVQEGLFPYHETPGL